MCMVGIIQCVKALISLLPEVQENSRQWEEMDPQGQWMTSDLSRERWWACLGGNPHTCTHAHTRRHMHTYTHAHTCTCTHMHFQDSAQIWVNSGPLSGPFPFWAMSSQGQAHLCDSFNSQHLTKSLGQNKHSRDAYAWVDEWSGVSYFVRTSGLIPQIVRFLDCSSMRLSSV